MFYERFREQEQVKEKESENDIEELSLNHSSEELQQLTNTNERLQKTDTNFENYQKKELENNPNSLNVKNYLSPYLNKTSNKYNFENRNKDRNYITENKSEMNYEKKIFDYNENIIRKNETEVNNYKTEENTRNLNFPQNTNKIKYEITEKISNPKSIAREKAIKKLNFSYDENVNNFDNYNKIKNVKNSKELIKMEYNNITFNEKIDTDNNSHSKNLKYSYKINNIKNDISKNPNNFSHKNLNYIKDDNIFNTKENMNIIKYQKKVETINVNSENKFKNEKEMPIIKTQQINNNYINNVVKTDKETEKPNFYFSYDYSTKIKNYDNKSSAKSELSTTLNTAKYNNNYSQKKNVNVKEFFIAEDMNQNEFKNKNQIYTKNNNNYSLNQKEQNYINNLKTLNTDINKEKPKTNSIVKNYVEKNIINNNNINEKTILSKKMKYYNSTNDLCNNIINNEVKEQKQEQNNLSSLLKKDYNNIKIVSEPHENFIDSKKQESYENYNLTNPNEKLQQNINVNKTPQKREIEIPDPINNNTPVIPEPYNLSTLESVMIRNMDEEEEIRTLELEKEKQKLEELEKEKQKLILEEKERRERIIKEIQRQEKQDIEKKKLMRKQYDEKMKKKKEDEEKLLKIKKEQQRQLAEINELKNNRKYDEQKLLLLTEGKLNKKQRTDYMLGIANKTVNSNKLPFRIIIDENNNELLINKMRNTHIGKSSKFWNYKNNIIESEGKNNLDNSLVNEDNYEENIIKDNADFEEIENNSEEVEVNKYKSMSQLEELSKDKKNQVQKAIENVDITNFNNDNKESKTIYKPKNKRININNNPLEKSGNNEYKTFSPKLTHKQNISVFSPVSEFEHNSNKLSTELFSFSANNILKEKKVEETKDINENVFKFDNEIIMDKKESTDDSVNKDYYEKKKYNFNKKKENNEITYKKYSDTSKGSFAKLNELREITSKLASEVEKKIQLINKNKLFSKAKSTPKLVETYSKHDYKNYKVNLDESKNNEEPIKEENKDNDEKDKEEKNKDKDKGINKKSYKYNQLIKETKMEITNLINNNQNQASKRKSLVGENNLPEEIKKECISELKKIENNAKKKGKENIQLNTGKVNKILDNINRNTKKFSTLKTYKTSTNFNQMAFYNDYLYGNKKKIQGQEIDQKFLPYYKEIYGETTPEKDV